MKSYNFYLKVAFLLLSHPLKAFYVLFYVVSHPSFHPPVKCCPSLLIVFLLSFTFSHPLKITNSHPLSYLFPTPFHLFIITTSSRLLFNFISFPQNLSSPSFNSRSSFMHIRSIEPLTKRSINKIKRPASGNKKEREHSIWKAHHTRYRHCRGGLNIWHKNANVQRELEEPAELQSLMLATVSCGMCARL